MDRNVDEFEDPISERLRNRMDQEKPLIGPELASLLADWNRYMRNRGASAGESDWHVLFLRWALLGRVAEFKSYAEGNRSTDTEKALAGIQKVYNFRWPHSAVGGYSFHFLWGWLQLELEKPGEKEPKSITEQRAEIEEGLACTGDKVKEWITIGGGLFAVIEDESGEESEEEEEESPLTEDEEESESEFRGKVEEFTCPFCGDDMRKHGGFCDLSIKGFKCEHLLAGWDDSEEYIFPSEFTEFPVLPEKYAADESAWDILNELAGDSSPLLQLYTSLDEPPQYYETDFWDDFLKIIPESQYKSYYDQPPGAMVGWGANAFFVADSKGALEEIRKMISKLTDLFRECEKRLERGAD